MQIYSAPRGGEEAKERDFLLFKSSCLAKNMNLISQFPLFVH